MSDFYIGFICGGFIGFSIGLICFCLLIMAWEEVTE